MTRTLDVYCSDERAGTLEQTREGLRFRYDDTWRTGGRPPLSHSLPLSGDLIPEAVRAFFAGLLPEGEPRRLLARRLQISEGNDFALLEALGGDCPGAISLYPPDAEPALARAAAEVRWLGEAGLAELIETLPERPMHAGEDGEVRLSLAGAQDKLPVVVDEQGRIGLTSGRIPSTHILKTPIRRLDGTVVNEAFCLMLGQQLGIPTVDAAPRRAGGAECLLVTRYDREHAEEGVRRLHQEDFCQALGIQPERKYEAEGGPSLGDCFLLVRTATSVPARHLSTLLSAVALNFIVGNHDAHAKNLSLLYRSSSVELAPLYDVLSTASYPQLARKMAMKIGGEYRPEYVERRHIDRLLESAGLAPAASRAWLASVAEQAPDAARAVRRRIAHDGWDHPILDRVLEVIDRRSERLSQLMRADGRSPA